MSYPSDRARVSDASVEQYTILNLLNFKTATVHFFAFATGEDLVPSLAIAIRQVVEVCVRVFL